MFFADDSFSTDPDVLSDPLIDGNGRSIYIAENFVRSLVRAQSSESVETVITEGDVAPQIGGALIVDAISDVRVNAGGSV